MAITRSTLIDDDGSGTTGSILNNAWQQGLYNQIDAAFILTTYGSWVDAGALSGILHNWNPANSIDKVVWYFFAQAGMEITGIGQGMPAGTHHVLFNQGVPFNIRHLNAGSAASNQIICPGYADYLMGSWSALTLIKAQNVNGWLALKAV